MKKIWKFLQNHIREDFHAMQYVAVFTFLAVYMTINYALNIENGYLEQLPGIQKFSGFFLMYAIAYFFCVSTYAIFRNKKLFFTDPMFWVKSIFGLGVLSLDSSLPFLRPTINEFVAPAIQYWVYKVSVNMISFFTAFLPILIFYFLVDTSQKHVYGLQPQKFDARPYFTMLLIMLPLIIMASFNTGFQRQYPMYGRSEAHVFLGVPEWITVAGYEIAYGLDFITVEYLFRGFFVIGMMTILGRGAVLSMAVVYCTLHFGKPAGEAMSSILGGYILGVVAYETKGIWGGVIVHMGIAWLMEIVAFIQEF